MVGFTNGHHYWLSLDKKWVIYVSDDEKHWIVGAIEALGLPIDINAWIYTDFSTCPEEESWTTFWDNENKEFIESTGNGIIKVECAERRQVTLNRSRGRATLRQDDWLKTMDKEEVEAKITSSTTSEICGRRPWSNVKDYQYIYPAGDPQGFSGLPYGPNLQHYKRRGRIIDGETSNFGNY